VKKYVFTLFFIIHIFLFSNDCVFNKIELEEKIGQMIMVGIDKTNLNDMPYIKKSIQEGKIGGILFLGYNIENPDQIKKLIQDLKDLQPKYPLFFAIDQEGGRIQRLNKNNGFNSYPSHENMVKQHTLEEAYIIYSQMALELKNIGFNVNFAPVVDLNTNPDCPIIGKLERSFSNDSKVVVDYSKEFIRAHSQNNILTVLKHFPGHGSAKSDSHKGFTDISDSWSKEELIPYQKLIDSSLNFGVMTGHLYNKNIDSIYPATLSSKHLSNLTEDLNHKGLIFTDDLEMKAISDSYAFDEYILRSVNSGNHILLFSGFNSDNKAIPEKVFNSISKFLAEKKIKNETIDSAFIKIINTKNMF